MDTTDTAVVERHFDAVSSIENAQALPIKENLTCNSHIFQNISLNLLANLCYMYDLDKLIRENNVTDEWGLNLVCELCEGKWNDHKTKTLQKDVFSNDIFLKKLQEVAKSVEIGNKDEILEIIKGFQIYLRNLSRIKTLKSLILEGSSFIDALSYVFQTEYIPNVLLQKNNEILSTTQQQDTDAKKVKQGNKAVKTGNGYESLSSIMGEKDENTRIVSLMSIVSDSKLNLAGIIRKEWSEDEADDSELIFRHYCYHLAKRNCKKIKEIQKKAKEGVALEDVIRNHFETEYVKKGKSCTIEDKKRMSFFSLIKNDGLRERFLRKIVLKHDDKINQEIDKVFAYLRFPGKMIINKQGLLELVGKEKEENRLRSRISKCKKALREDVVSEVGNNLIMNYLFDGDFEVWCENLVVTYIESKPRIEAFVDGYNSLLCYMSFEEEFNASLVKLCKTFSKTSNVEYKEKGEINKNKSNRIKQSGELLLSPNEFIKEIGYYFLKEVEYEGKNVPRYIKELSCYHYEGTLAGWMYSICNNFLKKYKKKYIASQTIKKFKLSYFRKLLRDDYKELKENPNVKRIEQYTKSRNYLEKCGLTWEQGIARVRREDMFPNFMVVLKCALTDYSWLFWNFKKEDFEVKKMVESIEKNQASPDDFGNWKSFNLDVRKIDMATLTCIKGKDVVFINVLPRLVALSHILYSRYISEDGDMAVLRDEKTKYETLGAFYGMNYDQIKTIHHRASKELKNRISPFIDKFKECDFLYDLPDILQSFSDLFIPAPEYRDCLKSKNTCLFDKLSNDLTDADILAKLLITKYELKNNLDKNDLEEIHTTLESRLISRRTNLKLDKSAKRKEKKIMMIGKTKKI